MKVAVVDADMSYPPTNGKRLRTLNLILRMAHRHQITYICRGNGDATANRQTKQFLGDHRIDSLIVDHPLPRKSGMAFYGRLAMHLMSPLPYSVTSHESVAMRNALQAHALRGKADLWHFEWAPCAAPLAGRTDTPKVLNLHSLDSLVWQRYYESEASLLRRWYIKQELRKTARFEHRMFGEFARIVACSDEEAAVVRQRFATDKVSVVENGIDRAYFENVRGASRPNSILFLGALDYRPNQDAVALLLDRIFPAVVAEEPAAQLCIVGRNPSARLIERVKNLPQVELCPNVEDVRPYLAQCGVMVVPLRIGGGSRLKILESLACGLPVVSTRVGAEGLDLASGRDLEIVDEIDELAPLLIQCIRDPARFVDMAQSGRGRVLEHYDWDVLADKLHQVWEECVGRTRIQPKQAATGRALAGADVQG